MTEVVYKGICACHWDKEAAVTTKFWAQVWLCLRVERISKGVVGVATAAIRRAIHDQIGLRPEVAVALAIAQGEIG